MTFPLAAVFTGNIVQNVGPSSRRPLASEILKIARMKILTKIQKLDLERSG